MKSVFIIALFCSLAAQAKPFYVCVPEDNYGFQFKFEKLDNISYYELVVDESYDTITWWKITFDSQNKPTVEEWTAGNDSDNYYGYPTKTLVTCIEQVASN